jgi:hypothetical protein
MIISKNFLLIAVGNCPFLREKLPLFEIRVVLYYYTPLKSHLLSNLTPYFHLKTHLLSNLTPNFCLKLHLLSNLTPYFCLKTHLYYTAYKNAHHRVTLKVVELFSSLASKDKFFKIRNFEFIGS